MSFGVGGTVIALGSPLARSGAQRGPKGPRASVATTSRGLPKATPKGRAVTVRSEGWDTV